MKDETEKRMASDYEINACFCVNLYSGKESRWERYDVQGEIKPEHMPDWAKERLFEI